MVKRKSRLTDDKVFAWLALAVGIVLLIPLLAMQVVDEMSWGVNDFVVAGALLYGAGAAFILLARRVRKTEHRFILGLALLVVLAYIWAELAVGVFTTIGS